MKLHDDWNDWINNVFKNCDPSFMSNFENYYIDDLKKFFVRALAVRNSPCCNAPIQADSFTQLVADVKTKILSQMITEAFMYKYLPSTFFVCSRKIFHPIFRDLVDELITKNLNSLSFEILDTLYEHEPGTFQQASYLKFSIGDYPFKK